MAQRIGKYEIVATLGRGGMGKVLRAYDPALDRPVAIKVIADEIEVTEELRARFFREAKACARLTHENIVTVFDMGEDEGRLYIVMELLEGEELRRLIAERRRLSVEDKISLMVQVCAGLHYAHQQGVVHRDIKPGNIMALPGGVAKIVDFGIALVPALGSGRTRSGAVMGTLRYMAPEQAHGRATHLSDMFSLGSVFYELLAYRAAFPASDAMEVLDQVRAQDPLPLDRIDGTIPPELCAVIARAMQKDPGDRFADLREMRLALERVLAAMRAEAGETRRRLEEKQSRVAVLGHALAECVGAPARPSAPTPDAGAPLALLRAAERVADADAERLARALSRSQELAPRVDVALAHLAARRFGEAIADLEAVVAAVPDHARAQAALRDARAGRDRTELEARIVGRIDRAAALFERGEYGAALDALGEIADQASELGLSEELEGLRRATHAAIAAKEAADSEERDRQRARVEAVLPLLEEARGLALDVDAPRWATPLWQRAEALAAEGRDGAERNAHRAASDALDEAVSLYRRAEEHARQVLLEETLGRQRGRAERAMQRMAQQQMAARAADAERRAVPAWSEAIARARDGEAAMRDAAFAVAAEAFDAASGLFREAEEQAKAEARRGEMDRRRAEAEAARAQCDALRGAAGEAQTAVRAASLWHAAESRRAAADAAMKDAAYPRAARLFAEAGRFYEEGNRAADAVLAREERRAAQSLARATETRARAEAAGAPSLASAEWAAAETAMAAGRSAQSARNLAAALDALERAAEGFGRAADEAAATRARRREAVERRLLEAKRLRDVAAAADAASRSTDPWREAEQLMRQAEEALDADRLEDASAALTAAGDRYEQIALEARERRDAERVARERDDAERALADAVARRAAAEAAGAGARAAADWSRAEESVEAGRRALEAGQNAAAAAAFARAGALYREAERSARDAADREDRARRRAAAERAREAMAAARARATGADAPTRAPAEWTDAESRASEARAALTRSEHDRAAALFGEAGGAYERAEAVARVAIRADEARRQHQVAEQARQLMARRRSMAESASASVRAADLWRAACVRADDAESAFAAGDHVTAGRQFTAATALFREAEESAQRTTGPVPSQPDPIPSTVHPFTSSPPNPFATSQSPDGDVRDGDAPQPLHAAQTDATVATDRGGTPFHLATDASTPARRGRSASAEVWRTGIDDGATPDRRRRSPLGNPSWTILTAIAIAVMAIAVAVLWLLPPHRDSSAPGSTAPSSANSGAPARPAPAGGKPAPRDHDADDGRRYMGK